MLVSTRFLPALWGLCCVFVTSPVMAQGTSVSPAKLPVSLASRTSAQPFQSLIDDVIISQPCRECGKQNKNRCCEDCGPNRQWTWTTGHRSQPIEREVDRVIEEADQLVRKLQSDQPSRAAEAKPAPANAFNQQLSDLLLLSLKANSDDPQSQRVAVETALRLAQEHGRSQSSHQFEERLDRVTNELVQLKRERRGNLSIDIAPKYSQPMEEVYRQLLGPEQQRANLKSLAAAIDLLDSEDDYREIRNEHFRGNRANAEFNLHERELAGQLDRISNELSRLQSNFRQWSETHRAYRNVDQPANLRYAELKPAEHRPTTGASNRRLPNSLRSLNLERTEAPRKPAESMQLQPLYQANDPLRPIN